MIWWLWKCDQLRPSPANWPRGQENEIDAKLTLIRVCLHHIVRGLKIYVFLLHSGGFVHGDLHEVNMMVLKDEIKLHQGHGEMVLDLDWSGKVGESTI